MRTNDKGAVIYNINCGEEAVLCFIVVLKENDGRFVDVIQSGKLSQEHRINELLQSIINMKKLIRGILRISCPTPGIEGRLFLSGNSFIIGAEVSTTGETGYDAVKKLLCVADASYALLDPGADFPSQTEHSLHISISKLLTLLPDLPDNISDLFDEEALLDEIFGPHPHRSAEIPLPRDSPPADSGEAAKSSPPLWAVLNPLLGTTPPPDNNEHLSASHVREDKPYYHSDTHFQALKAHVPEKKWLGKPLIWAVILTAIAALVLFFCGSSFGFLPTGDLNIWTGSICAFRRRQVK